MKNQIRQGDVYLVRVDALPENAEKAKSKIVARGEHSNHSHIITGGAEVFEFGEKMYVEVGQEVASIEHLLETAYLEGRKEWTKEHGPIYLEEGVYEVRIQRQYNPYDKVAERVLD